MTSYYVYSGAAGANNGTSWANAFTSLVTAFATEAAGDTLFLAHDHAEATGSAITLTSSGTFSTPSNVICVNRAGSVPPVSADRRTTAQVATTGNFNIVFAGCTHYDGIIFTAGNSTGAVQLNLSESTAWARFDNCSLRLGSNGATARIGVGISLGGAYIELNNTTLSFAAVGQTVQIGGVLKWRDTPSALLGTIPTILFVPLSGWGGIVDCEGIDFSAAGSGKTIVGTTNGTTAVGVSFRFSDCKMDAAVTQSAVPTANGGTEADFIRTGSSGINYTVRAHRLSGLLTEETTIVRTGGANDGTTAIAWKIVTTANNNYSMPYVCPSIAIWNDTTGSPVTATVEGIWGGGAVPLDNEIWLECEYLGDASSPKGSFINDGTADLLTTAANQTSSSATWGGSTTKFKLAVTFTPQQKGWLYARVKCAKASSTFYIDPFVTLT